jgi:hypothetical protein
MGFEKGDTNKDGAFDFDEFVQTKIDELHPPIEIFYEIAGGRIFFDEEYTSISLDQL